MLNRESLTQINPVSSPAGFHVKQFSENHTVTISYTKIVDPEN
nr:MAG TPA: hypothetical protein [Caudoviricetes sp.]